MTPEDDSGAPRAHHDTPRRGGRLLPTTRLDAFSDGVFAIVITLLVLELDVPESASRLFEDLRAEWPSFLGYLVSFAFIGGVWVEHINLTRVLRAADAVFLRLNLLLLLFVSFLPFTTSLMATHLADAARRPATVAFGLNLTLAILMSNVLIVYAVRAADLTDEAGRAELPTLARERWSAAVLMAASTVLAAFLPQLAVAFYLAAAVVLLAEPFRVLRVRRHRAGTGRG
ncbi:TMEM175 family protein [Rhodococcus rhodochrous]|uniref:Integral membrane protein n=1 Tax=Rhodococcus rhodochrous KG-21 TaxID=1441923 RepID=A0A0M8PBQ3_RHORH|nr:TMEM175 family protein [Rhodococcus rhodochrous]KOS53176.1 hypothetical protein Z051_26995 [Rhodococcus rhodochrous KG-21]